MLTFEMPQLVAVFDPALIIVANAVAGTPTCTDRLLGKTASTKLVASKVIMSGVNSNVIMSGYGNENPDDEGREAARGNTKSVSRRANDGESIVGCWESVSGSATGSRHGLRNKE